MNWWTEDGVDELVAWVGARSDCAFEPGLNELELLRAERTFELAIPPLWRAVLAQVHPVALRQERGGGVGGRSAWTPWPDWRLRDFGGTELMIQAPIDGLLTGVDHGFWWSAWGPRPASQRARAEVARAHLAAAPRLTPLFGHSYAAGDDEPVFTIVEAAVTIEAPTLRELATGSGRVFDDAGRRAIGAVPFWSELATRASGDEGQRRQQAAG